MDSVDDYDSPEALAEKTLFSEQEAAVVFLVLRGRSNAEIAGELGIPKSQVEMNRYQRIRPKVRDADNIIARAKATKELGNWL